MYRYGLTTWLLIVVGWCRRGQRYRDETLSKAIIRYSVESWCPVGDQHESPWFRSAECSRNEREYDTWRAVTLCQTALVRASSVSAHRRFTCVPIGSSATNWSDVPFLSLLHNLFRQCSRFPYPAVQLHAPEDWNPQTQCCPAYVLMLLLHYFRCRVALSQQRACRVAGAAGTAGIIHIQPFVWQAMPPRQFPGSAVSGQDRSVHIGQCIMLWRDHCWPMWTRVTDHKF